MAELSKNGCGHRDAGLSQGPWQKLQPLSWVWAERGDLVTWGYTRGSWGPRTHTVIHARQAASFGVTWCSGEEPEQAPPSRGSERSGVTCLPLWTALRTQKNPATLDLLPLLFSLSSFSCQ